MKTIRKSYKAEGLLQLPEDAPEGSVRAVISTFDVIDSDGDVVKSSAIKEGTPVRLCYWGHRWGDLPVGKGVLHNDGKQAIFDGQFFLDTEAGAETYKTVKNLGDLQEWSWGFSVPKGGYKQGEQEGRSVRYITETIPYEVSPVLIGANPVTGTTDIKGASDDEENEDEGTPVDEGTPSEDETKAVRASMPAKEELYSQVAEGIRGLIGLELEESSEDESHSMGTMSSLIYSWREIHWYICNERMREGEAIGMMGQLSAEEKSARLATIRDELAKHMETARELGLLEEPAEGTEEGIPYAQQAEAVLLAVTHYLYRSRSLADLRKSEGRSLGEGARARLSELVVSLREATTEAEELLATPDPDDIKARKAAQRDRDFKMAESRLRSLGLANN